jgi:hypothetical protein
MLAWTHPGMSKRRESLTRHWSLSPEFVAQCGYVFTPLGNPLFLLVLAILAAAPSDM